MNRVILGIDPGFDRVGWAVCRVMGPQVSVLNFGCIQTSKHQPLVERYRQIDAELNQVISQFKPTEAAIESVFFTKNQTTAMQVAEARGVIISLLFRHNLSYGEYTPTQVKQGVTGYGKADKAAVEKMVRLQLKLPPTNIMDDTLDALAVCLTQASRRIQIGV